MALLRRVLLATAGVLAAQANQAYAQNTAIAPNYSNFGGVGLLETRSARMAPDGFISTTLGFSPALKRRSGTFQVTPWLEGTFNYNSFTIASSSGDTVDRQFDVKARLLQETDAFPEIAIGFQDFLGTGIFSGEYVVASKRFGPLDFSLGLGWGSLAETPAFSNPLRFVSDRFAERDRSYGKGGKVNVGQYFRGPDVGVFGGVVYDTPIDGLRLIAEYDSDTKKNVKDFESKTPVNVGLSYTPFDGIAVKAAYLQGSEVSVGVSIAADISRPSLDAPKASKAPSFAVREGRGLDPVAQTMAPPLTPRAAAPLEGGAEELTQALAPVLKEDGVLLRRLILSGDTLRIEVENDRYRSVPQAVGRIARRLTGLAPTRVERFAVALYETGVAIAEFDLNREQLEASARERGYTASPPVFTEAYRTANIDDAQGDAVDLISYPRLKWSLGPDVRFSLFDPDNPLRYNLDAVAKGSAEVAPGLFLSGAARADLFGNFDQITRESDSVLPHVRSDFAKYYRETDIGIERLAADYYFKPADNVFAKLSAGYLEPQFAGVGGEILYRPPGSRFALGGNLYYARKRDYDGLFGLQNYGVVTGQGSLYFDTGFYDLNLALHAGRYLAGDWGATFEVTRRFSNGWEVGAFATFTDVPFEQFGEGSFDKGLIFRAPLDWALPYETRSIGTISMRPLQRDGGQRLRPGGEDLFRLTQPYSSQDAKEQWNDFSK